MRESTKVLLEALDKEIKTPAIRRIIREAKKEHYNDYFGIYDAPQHTLIQHLRDAKASKEIIERVMNGDFDGTKAESQEWMESEEGQSALSEIFGHRGKTKE